MRTCTVLRLYTSLRAGGPIDLKLPELSPPKLPEAVELAVPPIDFGGRKEGVAEVKGRGKDGAFGTLSDSLASVIAAYSEPVAVPATQLTEESSDEERLVAEWTGTLATAVEGERCKLRRRQAALAHYGCGVLEELRSHAEKLQVPHPPMYPSCLLSTPRTLAHLYPHRRSHASRCSCHSAALYRLAAAACSSTRPVATQVPRCPTRRTSSTRCLAIWSPRRPPP